jgi:cytochrome b561
MASQGKATYSGLQVSLHWVIAVLVLFQLIFGESMTVVRDASESGEAVEAMDQSLATAHYWVGWAILVLVVLRLLFRLIQGAPVPVGTGRMATLASAAHWLFYLLLIAVPVTGLLAIYVSDELGDIHSLGKPILIALIVLHFLGALYHHFKLKDGTLARMLPFLRA